MPRLPRRPSLPQKKRRSYAFLPLPPTDPFGMQPYDPALPGVGECLFADAPDADGWQAEGRGRCESGVRPWPWPWECVEAEIGEECAGDVEPENSEGVLCRSGREEVCERDIRGDEGAEEDSGMVVKKW